jgi:hypothetical protein
MYLIVFESQKSNSHQKCLYDSEISGTGTGTYSIKGARYLLVHIKNILARTLSAIFSYLSKTSVHICKKKLGRKSDSVPVPYVPQPLLQFPKNYPVDTRGQKLSIGKMAAL